MKKILLSVTLTLILCCCSMFVFTGCGDTNTYEIIISADPSFSWVDQSVKGYQEDYENKKEAGLKDLTFTFKVNGAVHQTPKLDEEGKEEKDADGNLIMESWENLSYADFCRLGGFVTVNLYDENTTTMRVSWGGTVQEKACTVTKS